jgi:hypothetical protein
MLFSTGQMDTVEVRLCGYIPIKRFSSQSRCGKISQVFQARLIAKLAATVFLSALLQGCLISLFA